MMQKRTIQTFFQKAILRYAGLGMVGLCLVSLSVSFFLGRDQSAGDLQETARITAQAFRDRIIDGDIRSVEPQIRQVLKLHEGESAQILKADLTRVYESAEGHLPIQECQEFGVSCFDSYFGQARILYPIALDSQGHTAFRYLYIAKDIRMNWSFFFTVFIVSIAGALGLVIAFFRVSKFASGRLSAEIGTWSIRLRENPKEASPLVHPPFSELLPLKEAIEGLNLQIEFFERTATDKAKLLILRGIAHDLLTPVARLQLYLATLETNIDRNANEEVLAEIQDSLTRVIRIASQVKDLKESETSPVGADLIESTKNEVNALRDSDAVKTKELRLEFSSSYSRLPSPFSKTEISRIVSNLVKNAAEASSRESVIRVEVGENEGAAFLSVADQGCGIPDNFKKRVFDPDFTMKPSTGTGLGLSIVKHICEQRAATVELASQFRKGTTVTITYVAKINRPLGEMHV